MGLAPAIGAAASAVGTISAVSAQRRQAAAQRAVVESNRLAARQAADLSQRRFDYSRQQSAAMFAREQAILRYADEQARRDNRMQDTQRDVEDAQLRLQRSQFNASTENQIQSMLANASQARGGAALANLQQIGQTQLQDVTPAFAQRLAAMGMTSPNTTLDSVRSMSLLDMADQVSRLQESMATLDRTAGFQAESLENSAGRTRQYQSIVDRFLAAQQQARADVDTVRNQVMPNLLDLQSLRNNAALEAARLTRESNSSLAEQSAALQLANQERQANAQLASIPRPNYLGAVASIASSVAPVIAASQMQQPQQQFGFSPNWVFQNNPNIPVQPAPTYSSGFGTFQMPTILDVPEEIPYYA